MRRHIRRTGYNGIGLQAEFFPAITDRRAVDKIFRKRIEKAVLKCIERAVLKCDGLPIIFGGISFFEDSIYVPNFLARFMGDAFASAAFAWLNLTSR